MVRIHYGLDIRIKHYGYVSNEWICVVENSGSDSGSEFWKNGIILKLASLFSTKVDFQIIQMGIYLSNQWIFPSVRSLSGFVSHSQAVFSICCSYNLDYL